MSTKTTNFNFIKPEKSDPADITSTNENWDKLDEALINRDADLSMNGHKITDVADPERRSDVATRGFVEDFSIEGSTYVAVDENNDGNVVLRPYIPLVDDAVDYIVERGTDETGVWEYEKWNSGKAVCWCVYSYSGSIETSGAADGSYVSAPISINFPQNLFVATPKILVSPQFGFIRFHVEKAQWSYNSAAVANGYQICTYRAVTAEEMQEIDAPFSIVFEAVGKWK